MATYTELAQIAADESFGSLVEKVRVACVIKAVALLDLATPTASQVTWATDALNNPSAAASSIIWYVIGANSGANQAQILNATDNAVQANVDAAVDKIVAVA